ncbi:hypothetical protein EYC84_003722 [Monilinia fructicola]|uniref:Uncharacterized protein n=1 Tax=Monilinia fructicola TaxID=38448 RepID=A0A5M9JXK8_MONFR|nr:hypothetical protein EYC84_003722 [Monilinia fructicola]
MGRREIFGHDMFLRGRSLILFAHEDDRSGVDQMQQDEDAFFNYQKLASFSLEIQILLKSFSCVYGFPSNFLRINTLYLL